MRRGYLKEEVDWQRGYEKRKGGFHIQRQNEWLCSRMRVRVKQSSCQPFAHYSGSIAFWRSKPPWRQEGEGDREQRRRKPEVLHARWLLCPLPLTLVRGFSSFDAHLATGSSFLITQINIRGRGISCNLATAAAVSFLCFAAHMRCVSRSK